MVLSRLWILTLWATSLTRPQTISSAEITDGIAVTHQTLANHPKGILVVQDGFNFDSEQIATNQNYKMIDWRAVEEILGPEKRNP